MAGRRSILTWILACALVLGAGAVARAQEEADANPGAATEAEDGTAPEDVKRLLVLTHSAGFRHPVLPTAEKTLQMLAESRGWLEVESLTGYAQERSAIDLSMITAAGLADYDGVLFFTTGELPLDETQKAALLEFVRGGGAFIGVHSATDTFYKWPEYGELIGAYFQTHGRNDQPLTLNVEDEDHPATRMLEDGWEIADEFYQFELDDEHNQRRLMPFSRERVHVLLSVDTEASEAKGQLEAQKPAIALRWYGMPADRDYPLAWVREYGEGRMFYTALGHREEVWLDELFQQHLLGGMRWALGLED